MDAGNVFKIIVAKSCRKEINRHSAKIRQDVDDAIEKISKNPYRGEHIKPLQGSLKGMYRYDIGQFRLIYIIDAKEILVSVVDFGPRGDIYK